MVEELPTEYDAIVLGTGFSESVVAAALSRAGNKVLHLDRNDYYSGQWATLTFDALQKWIEQSQTKSANRIVESSSSGEETPRLEPGTHSVPVPCHSHEISNVVVKSYFCEKEKEKEEASGDSEFPNFSATDVSEQSSNHGEVSDSEISEKEQALDESPVSQTTAVVEELSLGEGQKEKLKESNGKILPTENSGDSDRSVQTGGSSSEVVCEGKTIAKELEEVWAKQDEESSTSASPTTPSVEEPRERLGIHISMTLEELKPFWRRFNIDISPKLLFSRGRLVESLISANISHYTEFKAVTRILTYMEGRIEEVPCSRGDVFSSNVISIVEKRMLMKFLTFCLDFDENPDQYKDYEDKTFSEYLQSRRLTPNLQHFIIHAIAMVKQETPTVLGLKATQSFLQSLGRYGNTPFIWPLYGSGELPQAFCRMCAVFSGLYCLRRGASAVVIDEATKQCLGIISDNQLLKCRWLIMEHSYVPEQLKKDCAQTVSRAVFITSCSLKVCEEQHVTLLSVPPLEDGGEPVRVIELSSSTLACPKGVYIVHLVCKGTSSAQEDLEPIARHLFHFPTQGDLHGEKPTVLWSLYFNQAVPDSSIASGFAPNVYVTSLPGASIGFNDAMQEAKQIFDEICPNEEFLAAVPNPEDIILDDFLHDPNQNVNEQPPVEDVDSAVQGPSVQTSDSETVTEPVLPVAEEP